MQAWRSGSGSGRGVTGRQPEQAAEAGRQAAGAEQQVTLISAPQLQTAAAASLLVQYTCSERACAAPVLGACIQLLQFIPSHHSPINRAEKYITFTFGPRLPYGYEEPSERQIGHQ